MNQRGLSLVELLVGLAIGMLVLATATRLYVDYLQATKRTLLHARISQDLRATAGLLTRELRRTGHWAAADGSPDNRANPHATVEVGDADVLIGYDRTATVADGLAPSTGFRLRNGVMQMRSVGPQGSAGWQSLTDPAVLQVTRFAIEHQRHTVELHRYCDCLVLQHCDEAGLQADPDRPRLVVHRFDTVLRARARHDASIEREVRDSIGARNEQFEGRCP